MKIFIDESKLFAYTPKPNSWNVVACYAVSDNDYIQAQNILKEMKISAGFKEHDEVKINKYNEPQYVAFLKEIRKLEGTLHAVATDSSLNTLDAIKLHQAIQGEKIVEHKDKMIYDEGKEALDNLKKRVISLSPQLYVQLFCQLILIYNVIKAVIPYYISRDPKTLSKFQWRIDQKDTTKTNFENVFEILGPAIIQSRSITDPLLIIEGLDYSVLDKYMYKKSNAPKYLKNTYGLDIEDGYDIQAIIREDIDFVDSKEEVGVQIADILASGLRKCLCLEFSDNNRISYELGKLMVRTQQDSNPVDLLCFSKKSTLNNEVANLIRIMIRASKPLLAI